MLAFQPGDLPARALERSASRRPPGAGSLRVCCCLCFPCCLCFLLLLLLLLRSYDAGRLFPGRRFLVGGSRNFLVVGGSRNFLVVVAATYRTKEFGPRGGREREGRILILILPLGPDFKIVTLWSD